MQTGTLTRETLATDRSCLTQPQLILVLERARPLAAGARHSLANIDRVTLGRGATRSTRRFVEGGLKTLALALPDTRLSTLHAVLERRDRGWRFTDCRSKNGSRVRGTPASSADLRDGDLLELGGSFLRFRAAMRTPVTAAGDVDLAETSGLVAAFGTLLPALSAELESLARVARSEVSVLLLGESGTGKEVLARAIHRETGREGPFVPVNCGALPPSLVESMLFGHRKGAFSGANADAPGFVRAAHGGTLFLDEVGDLPSAAQAALLRVLQEREVVPVGETRAVPVDMRIVAATHRPLARMVSAGTFRNDLFARLASFTFVLPPLRERPDDLGALVAAVLRRVAGERAASLSLGTDAARTLIDHDWPHNVRELEQCLSVSSLLVTGDRIERVALAERPTDSPPNRPPSGRDTAPVSAEDEALRAFLVEKLTELDGNLTRVGQAMGKARTQVQRWVKRFEIDPREFRR